MSLNTVLDEIQIEREYQDGEWGTEFDDKNTLNDWVIYIMNYMGQAARMDASLEEQRKNMLKAATLAVAAVESFDRNERFAPRHYEDRVPSDIRPGDDAQSNTDDNRLKLINILDEIQTVRMVLELLLDDITTDDQLIQRTESIDALLCLIEHLVRTAHQLKEQAKSEKPG